jgi:hypothetical protein
LTRIAVNVAIRRARQLNRAAAVIAGGVDPTGIAGMEVEATGRGAAACTRPCEPHAAIAC